MCFVSLVIDYLGFRLIAITILPINNTTIQYGSYGLLVLLRGGGSVTRCSYLLGHSRCDAGQTVYADDPRLNEMMEQAGRKMKLQVHGGLSNSALLDLVVVRALN